MDQVEENPEPNDDGQGVLSDGALSSEKTSNDVDAIVELTDTRSARARRWTPLESITVKNFKAAKEATIPLARVTVLVGPNGSGKSSVLQAIHWAARAASYVLPKIQKK
jgi:excinuclease UvrABC ATPase subunit